MENLDLHFNRKNYMKKKQIKKEYVPWDFNTVPKTQLVCVSPKEIPDVIYTICAIEKDKIALHTATFAIPIDYKSLFDHYDRVIGTKRVPCGTLKKTK